MLLKVERSLNNAQWVSDMGSRLPKSALPVSLMELHAYRPVSHLHSLCPHRFIRALQRPLMQDIRQRVVQHERAFGICRRDVWSIRYGEEVEVLESARS